MNTLLLTALFACALLHVVSCHLLIRFYCSSLLYPFLLTTVKSLNMVTIKSHITNRQLYEPHYHRSVNSKWKEVNRSSDSRSIRPRRSPRSLPHSSPRCIPFPCALPAPQEGVQPVESSLLRFWWVLFEFARALLQNAKRCWWFGSSQGRTCSLINHVFEMLLIVVTQHQRFMFSLFVYNSLFFITFRINFIVTDSGPNHEETKG